MLRPPPTSTLFPYTTLFRSAAARSAGAAARLRSVGVARSSEEIAEALREVAGAVGPAEKCLRSRSEEHTSELQSRQYLVCRLLLEKKKQIHSTNQVGPSPRL